MSNLPIRRISVHCSDTRPNVDIGARTIRIWHTTPVAEGGRGWHDIGYHYVIRLNGSVEKGRQDDVEGAAVQGFNEHTLAICYVGGSDARGQPADTRTPAQKVAMAKLVRDLCVKYGISASHVFGHRDLAFKDFNHDGRSEPGEWLKECPCFAVLKERTAWVTTGRPA